VFRCHCLSAEFNDLAPVGLLCLVLWITHA